MPCNHLSAVLFLSLGCLTLILAETFSDTSEYQIISRVIKRCSLNGNKYSCLANKAAVAVERAIQLDIPLFDGFVLARNEEYVDNETMSRSWSNGIGRLTSALSRFLDSHTVKLDLTKIEPRHGGGGDIRAGDGGGIGGGGGDIGGGGKLEKKGKKYLHYALLGLLGVFGISGPLMMKVLSIIAGKALIASKIALLIVGSVALKKIFDSDHHQPSVKVHTHTIDHHDDDYDRNINIGAYKFLNTI